MVTVEITNYESIEHIEFSFDKFSTIVGKNFIGKSSIFRAINAALTNQQGTNFIRWGADFCEVKIKSKDLDLLWHKESGNNFYVINGVKKDKVGNEPPPDQIREAGLGLVQLSNQKINLFYCEQFFPLFLVDKKDSKSADLIASVYGLDKLYKAAELCNKDQKNNKGLLTLRKKDLLTAERDMQKYEQVKDLFDDRDALRRKNESLCKEEQVIEKLRELSDYLLKTSEQCKRLQPVQKIQTLTLGSLRKEMQSFKDLNSLQKEHQGLSIRCKKLSVISKVEVPSSKKVENAIEELRKLKSMQEEYEKTLRDYEKSKAVSDIKVPSIDFDIKALESLKEMVKKATELKKTVIETKGEISKLEDEKKTLEDKKSAFEVCPLCKKEL